MEARPEERLRFETTLVVLLLGLVPNESSSSSSSVCRGRDKISTQRPTSSGAVVKAIEVGVCWDESRAITSSSCSAGTDLLILRTCRGSGWREAGGTAAPTGGRKNAIMFKIGMFHTGW